MLFSYETYSELLRVGEIAQHAKSPATKSSELSSTAGTYMGGEENTLPQSWPQHLYHSTFMLTYLHTLMFIHTHANKQVS